MATVTSGDIASYAFSPGSGGSVLGPWEADSIASVEWVEWSFFAPTTIRSIFWGPRLASSNIRPCTVDYWDGSKWVTVVDAQLGTYRETSVSLASHPTPHTRWRVYIPYKDSRSTTVSYSYMRIETTGAAAGGKATIRLAATGYARSSEHYKGTGKASIRLTAAGTSWTPTRYTSTGKATIQFAATGKAWALERAFHLERRPTSTEITHRAALNRVNTGLYLDRVWDVTTPAGKPRGLAGAQPVRLATAFNGSRLWNARARLRVRLSMTGREGSQAWMQFGFELDNYGFLHTHVQSATMLVSLHMVAKGGSVVIHGEAAPMHIDLGMSGRYPSPQPDTPSEGPGGEVLPGYESRLRVHFDLWPRPSGTVIKSGTAEVMPIEFGMETEHRPFMLAPAEPLELNLLGGRRVRYYDWWYKAWVNYTIPGWLGYVYPAAQLAVDFIDFNMIGVGVQTQYGEAALSVNLDMTASYYPWGKAHISMSLDMRAKGKATYYGRYKPNVRMDYINFTGRGYSYGKMKRPLTIRFFTLMGSLADAIMGQGVRQRIRLHFRPRGAYVIRVIEPRPVEILTWAGEPNVVHHKARTEGI